MQDLVLRIGVPPDVDAAVEGGVMLEVAVLGDVEFHLLAEAGEHAVAGPPGAAGGADDLLAVEHDLAIVVGDDHEPA